MQETISKPLVSVIIPSYNHEAFIEECIQSVLDQTFQDFEIVITDDGSTDGTVEKIKRFSDPRIRLFEHAKNEGASIAANNCLRHARGEYIAMLSSDDAWLPEKLEIQVDYLQNHPEIYAVFTKINWIDENSELITEPDFYYKDIFNNAENRSRYEWLHLFFFQGNCLCHPSSLIRREVYQVVGLFDPRLANLPDLDLWVRVCLHYDIHILDQKLVNLRHFVNENNASGNNLQNNIRVWYEHRKILDHYLSITDPEEIAKIFPESQIYGNFDSQYTPFILGRIAIDAGFVYKILWGLDVLFEQLKDPDNAERIQTKFGFTYLDFIRLVGEHDTFGITPLLEQIKEASGETSEIVATPLTPLTKPNPLTKILRKIRSQKYLMRDINLVKNSDFFDKDWYLSNNPDVAAAKIDPIEHFLLHGGFEGRDPSRRFSSMFYLNTYPDVFKAGTNPLVHYLLYGKDEGRLPKP